MQDEILTETLSLTDEEKPLPEGWRLVRLGDVCFTTSGGTPARGVKEYYGGEIFWVKSGELKDNYIETIEETITELGLKESSAKLIPADTLLIALYGANVGKLGILKTDAAINQAICAIIPNDEVFTKYLFYHLLTRRSELINLSFGGAQPNISQEIVKKIKIPLPPTIEEQRRIASVLDEQIKAVEQARLAVEEQLKAANLLPNAFLRSVFESEEAQNWQKRKLGEMAKTCSGSTPSRGNPDYYKGSISWVKTGELKDGLILETEEHISELALKETSLRLLPPETLLVAMYGQGQTRGRTGVLKKPATTNQACFAILPNETFDSYFLQYWFRHNYQRLRQETEGRGGNQPNLNGDVLNKQIVSLPSEVTEQQKFVEKLNEQMQAVETLKQSLTEKLEAVKKLPAALLRKAFAGEI